MAGILHTSIGNIDLSLPKVMGILNLTPDSFYDGGVYSDDRAFLNQTERMLKEEADILDLGAVSTRPGSEEVSVEEEINRLLPILSKITKEFPQAILSVDTWRSEVARIAIANGAHIINDISAGRLDPDMFNTIAELDVPYILMHMQGTPLDMQRNPKYVDVVMEVKHFIKLLLNKLALLGVKNNVVIDPGFGFGKTPEHNFQLLKELGTLKDLGHPILAGVSRKSMINRVLGINPENALNGTTVLHAFALLNGANILRVHDVKEAKQAIQLYNFYNSI